MNRQNKKIASPVDIFEAIAVGAIKIYHNAISRIMIQHCRFYPSCSQYAVESIQKRGLRAGSWRALMRILRCHPFSAGGYDPVE